jgi:SAM-dependent methyltransferase
MTGPDRARAELTDPGPGLARLRALLDPTRLSAAYLDTEPDASRGYLDLLGGLDDQPRTPAQWAMRSGVVAAVYQRGWRAGLNLAMGLRGPGPEQERREAVRALELGGEQRVLDVACGPGNFTHVFAAALTGNGLAVGLDASRPMLDEAVARNVVPRAAYLRADARRVPFPDASFDAVCCYAALYLVPEPFSVLVEMLRVLAPGGRIALMTSYRGSWGLERALRSAVGAAAGMRLFERDELTGVLAAGGLVDIRQRVHGAMQFVEARRPLS